MNFDKRLDKLIERHDEIGGRLNEGQIQTDERTKLSNEYAELAPVIQVVEELRNLLTEMEDLEKLLSDPGSDGELQELAENEYSELKKKRPLLEQQIQILLK